MDGVLLGRPMNLMRACVATLAILCLAGCAGPGQVTGQVTGRLVKQGGQSPGQRPMSGTVVLAGTGHPQVTVRVTDSGNFSVRLPPGRYRISGPCSQSLPVTVTAHHATRVTLVCAFASGNPPSN
jgi:hypothetical protein